MPILQSTFSYAYIESLLRTLTRTLVLDEYVTPVTMMKIINQNTLNIASELVDADEPDYGEEQVLGDAATFYGTVVAGSHVDSTKTITKANHLLTKADVGRRIILVNDVFTIMGYSAIVTVPTTSTFTIADSMGTDLSGCLYTVLSRQSSSSLDVSSLRIAKIKKLKDSTNGLVTPTDDNTFEGLDIEDFDDDVFYNHFGQSLYLFKGRNVTAWGTLTLFYHRMVTLCTASTDYIDLDERRIPMLIERCEADLYKLVNQVPPTAPKAKS